MSYCCLNEAINFIDNCIYLQQDVKVNDNVIQVINKDKIKYIKLVGNELQIHYRNLEDYYTKKTVNIICKKVKTFNVKRSGKVIFVKISDDCGRECKRFIPLEN